MLQQGQSLFRSPAGTAAAVAGAAAICCAGLYMHLRPVLGDLKRPPQEHKITRARTRDAASSRKKDGTEALAYPPDAFPGGRQVKTAYGTIQVFEWGPEEGEKVLLLHGIGTPCVALGNMAKEFVSQGCRVMIFGMLRLQLSYSTLLEPSTHKLSQIYSAEDTQMPQPTYHTMTAYTQPKSSSPSHPRPCPGPAHPPSTS